MSYELKLCRIDTEFGLVLPDDVLSRLQLVEGDTLLLSEATEGFTIRSKKHEIAMQTAVFENLADRYQNTLRILSES